MSSIVNRRASVTVALGFLAAIAGAACGSSGGGATPAADSLLTPDERAALLALSPSPLPAPPADVTNRFADDEKAAAFGQRLFFDASFSGKLLDADNDGGPQSLGSPGQTGKVSCAGCHVPAGGFSDTRSFQEQVSLGAGWGRRRAPSLLDVGQATLLMWDGRHDALYNQVFGPLESVVEMNSSRLYEAERMFVEHRAEYEAIFGPMPPLDDAARFPPLGAAVTGCSPKVPSSPRPTCDGPFHGSPGDQAEFDGMSAADQKAVTTVVVNAGKAIGAFERKLRCGSSPFDAWMHGDPSAVSPAAQRGAALFVGKGKCVACHAGPFLSDQKFHDVGLAPAIVQQFIEDTNDHGAANGLAAALADPLNSLGVFSDGSDGRLPAAVAPQMEGAFRTPTLRCVSARPAFMHTGQLQSLAAVIAFFNRGGDGTGYAGASELHSLALTDSEESELVAFLQSLDGPGADAQYQHAP